MKISTITAAVCGISTLIAVMVLSNNWLLAGSIGWAVQLALITITTSLDKIAEAITTAIQTDKIAKAVEILEKK